MRKTVLALAVALAANYPALCLAAPTPKLYPNAHFKAVGNQQVQADIGGCSAEAESSLSESSAGRPGPRAAVGGAARGAAKGALAATIMNQSAGRGAGAGAAIGGLSAAGKSAKEKRSGSPEFQKYVEACLEDRGYKVVGWQ